MTRHDPEIEELRDKVHCAVVLEEIVACGTRQSTFNMSNLKN